MDLFQRTLRDWGLTPYASARMGKGLRTSKGEGGDDSRVPGVGTMSKFDPELLFSIYQSVVKYFLKSFRIFTQFEK